jgi:hypothetical protein
VILIPTGHATAHDYPGQPAADATRQVSACRPTASEDAPERSLAIRAAHRHLRRCAPSPPPTPREGFQNQLTHQLVDDLRAPFIVAPRRRVRDYPGAEPFQRLEQASHGPDVGVPLGRERL